ncbi:hypothetical protein PLESTM_001007100 [Pleodorina starrii]|nr:hypothetical protein PLESTM_001007100 [Pleodorina starrii]
MIREKIFPHGSSRRFAVPNTAGSACHQFRLQPLSSPHRHRHMAAFEIQPSSQPVLKHLRWQQQQPGVPPRCLASPSSPGRTAALKGYEWALSSSSHYCGERVSPVPSKVRPPSSPLHLPAVEATPAAALSIRIAVHPVVVVVVVVVVRMMGQVRSSQIRSEHPHGRRHPTTTPPTAIRHHQKTLQKK